MGGPLNLQPMLIRSRDELNWPVRVCQPVIPRKNVRSHEGIQMPNVWCYAYADSQSWVEEGNGKKSHLSLDRKSGL